MEKTETFNDQVVEEINLLHKEKIVTKCVHTGDLITSQSSNPGYPPEGRKDKLVMDEYLHAKREIARLHMPVYMIPGNHDTDASEDDAQLWAEQMESKPYQSLEWAGMPVLLLNTADVGMLDDEQTAWLREQAKGIPKDKELLIFQHIPTILMGIRAGSKRVIVEAFRERTAPVYVMSGHHHRFYASPCHYAGTQYFQMMVSTASDKIWGDKRKPGYQILALQDGQLKASIQRSFADEKFVVLPKYSEGKSKEITFPFDALKEPLASYEEGLYDKSGLVEFIGVDCHGSIEHCTQIQFTVRPGEYKAPIRNHILYAQIHDKQIPTVRISKTGREKDWQELVFPYEKIPNATSQVKLFPVAIPTEYSQAEQFYLEYDTGEKSRTKGNTIGGWALSSAEDPL